MKSILLKLDDKLFEETEALIKEEKVSRLSYIKQAIDHYNKWQKRKKMEAQMEKEIEIIKKDKEGWKEFKEWETASLTDLNNMLDQSEKK